MRNLIFFLGLGLLAALVVGCTPSQKEAAAEVPAPEHQNVSDELELVIPVQAELPKRGDIASHFETTSRVEAENHVQVMAEAIGACKEVCVEEGARVSVGSVLAKLDDTELLVNIGQTEVQLRQHKTSLDIADKSLQEGIGSKAERDNAQFAYDQGLSALKMQRVRLDKLTIRAPIKGVVTKRNIQVGQLIASGTPLFTIVDPSSFILNINVPENELSRLKPGQVGKVTIDALGNNKEYDARVRRINPGVDSTSGTVKVTLDFDDNVRQKLREAAFARVRLVMETHPNALLVSKDALIEENARKYLFVVVKSKNKVKTESPQPAASAANAKPEQTYIAKRVELETGLEDSNSIEVLSGINDHSLVVTMGQHTLKPDSVVRLTNANAELEKNAGMSAEDALKAAKEKSAAGIDDSGFVKQQDHPQF